MATIESVPRQRWGNRFKGIVLEVVRVLIYIRLWQVKDVCYNLGLSLKKQYLYQSKRGGNLINKNQPRDGKKDSGKDKTIGIQNTAVASRD